MSPVAQISDVSAASQSTMDHQHQNGGGGDGRGGGSNSSGDNPSAHAAPQQLPEQQKQQSTSARRDSSQKACHSPQGSKKSLSVYATNIDFGEEPAEDHYLTTTGHSYSREGLLHAQTTPRMVSEQFPSVDDHSSGLSYRDREERVRNLREHQHSERQQKLEELKEQAAAAQRFREQQEQVRRHRLEEMKTRDAERRHQVEERKRLIQRAEQERRNAMVKKNVEREQRIEAKRRNERSNIVFAFGSSTPRMLDPKDSLASFWGARRATSTTNVHLSESASNARRASECNDSDLSRKRATSAHSLDRKPDDLRMSSSMYEVFNWDDSNNPTRHTQQPLTYEGEDLMTKSMTATITTAARRRTDLMPTVPSVRDSPVRSSPRHRSPGVHSGTATPSSPSRPTSALSQGSGGSNVIMRTRASPRKPRPLSIAGTLPSSADKPKDGTGSSSPRESRPIERKLSVGSNTSKPLRAKSAGSDRGTVAAAGRTSTKSMPTKRTPAQVKAESAAKKAAEKNKSVPKVSHSPAGERGISSPSNKAKEKSPALQEPAEINKKKREVSDVSNAVSSVKEGNDPTSSENSKPSTTEFTEPPSKESLEPLNKESDELASKESIAKESDELASKESDELASQESIVKESDELPSKEVIVKESDELAIKDSIVKESDEPASKESIESPVVQISDVPPATSTEKVEDMPKDDDTVELQTTEHSGPVSDAPQKTPEDKLPCDSIGKKGLETERATSEQQDAMAAVQRAADKPVTGYATEEEYKAALAEKRRQAREARERELELQKQKELEMEEQQRKEEEEYLRLMEEQRLVEEERLKKAIEEADRQREEEQRQKEEAERLEQLRQQEKEEQMRREEEERQARKNRVAAIMARTRGKGGSSTPSKAEAQTPSDESKTVGEGIMSASMTDSVIAAISSSMTDSMIAATIESHAAKAHSTGMDDESRVDVTDESPEMNLPVSQAPPHLPSQESSGDDSSGVHSQELPKDSSFPSSADNPAQPSDDPSLQSFGSVSVDSHKSVETNLNQSLEPAVVSQPAGQIVETSVSDLKSSAPEIVVESKSSLLVDVLGNLEGTDGGVASVKVENSHMNGDSPVPMDTTPTQSVDLLGSLNSVNNVNQNGVDNSPAPTNTSTQNLFDPFDPVMTVTTANTNVTISATTDFEQVIDLGQTKLSNEDAVNSNPPAPFIAFEQNMNKKSSQDSTNTVPDLLL